MGDHAETVTRKLAVVLQTLDPDAYAVVVSALRSVEEELRQAREERDRAQFALERERDAREGTQVVGQEVAAALVERTAQRNNAEADRDRLAGALRHARGCITEQVGPMPTPSQRLALDTIDAALSPVQGEHEQDGEDAGGPSLDEVYAERNKVVLAFAALVKEQGWDVGLAVDPDSPDWPVLMIETDAGQVSWHFQAGELPPGLPLFAGKWDGHSTPEKYDRLAELVRSAFGLGEIAQDGDTEETT